MLLSLRFRHLCYSNEADGKDAIMFLSREYCERPLTDAELEKQRLAVSALRENLPTASAAKAPVRDASGSPPRDSDASA